MGIPFGSSLWLLERSARAVFRARSGSERVFISISHSARAIPLQRSRSKTGATVVLLGTVGATTIASASDDTSINHLALAFLRCERIARAVVYDAILYKRTFSKAYASDEEMQAAYSRCHRESAERILEALKANGGALFFGKNSPLELKVFSPIGIYIKLVGTFGSGKHRRVMLTPRSRASMYRPLTYFPWNGRYAKYVESEASGVYEDSYPVYHEAIARPGM